MAQGSHSKIRESFSSLADAAALVQYCINTCSAVDAAQRTIPLFPGAQSPASGKLNF
jgi:hypothetical protein